MTSTRKQVTIALMLATLITLVMAAGLSAYINLASLISMEPSPHPYRGEAQPVAYDATKPTAIVLMSNQGTEVTDLMGPYQLLKMSNLFNVYTVAPEREPIGVNGGVDILPDMSIEAMGLLLNRSPELVVVPAVHDPDNAKLSALISYWHNTGAHILSICEGARLVAASGILDGQQATSHFFALDDLESHYSAVDWQRSARYITDGDITSSAGVTAAYDATLALISQFGNPTLASSIAEQIEYESQTAIYVEFDSTDFLKGLASIVLPWGRTDQAIWISDGMDESLLSAALDSYPRTLEIDQVTVSDSRRLIRTKHGLQLIPRFGINELPEMDSILALSAADAAQLRQQALANDSALDTLQSNDGFSFSRVLDDIGQRYGESSRTLVAKQLEYPQ